MRSDLLSNFLGDFFGLSHLPGMRRREQESAGSLGGAAVCGWEDIDLMQHRECSGERRALPCNSWLPLRMRSPHRAPLQPRHWTRFHLPPSFRNTPGREQTVKFSKQHVIDSFDSVNLSNICCIFIILCRNLLQTNVFHVSFYSMLILTLTIKNTCKCLFYMLKLNV